MRLKSHLADWAGGVLEGGAEGVSAIYSCVDRHRPCNHCTDIQTMFGMYSHCFRVASSVSVPGSFDSVPETKLEHAVLLQFKRILKGYDSPSQAF